MGILDSFSISVENIMGIFKNPFDFYLKCIPHSIFHHTLYYPPTLSRLPTQLHVFSPYLKNGGWGETRNKNQNKWHTKEHQYKKVPKKSAHTYMQKNNFLLTNSSWDQGLPQNVVDTPSDTPLGKMIVPLLRLSVANSFLFSVHFPDSVLGFCRI